MSTDQIARGVLQRLEDAWNAADGEAFAAPYADGASFVTVRGELMHEQATIAAGHAQIFATIYAGSVNRMELVDAKRLDGDVIVATSRNTLQAPHGPLAGVHQAMSTSILVRSDSDWQIVSTHNTLVAAR